MNDRSFRLYQLADSALPIGGFAFSSGLEAMSKLGLIQTRQDFSRYLEAVIADLGNFDLPFLNSFFETPTSEAVWVEYHAMMLVPQIRKASITQGRGMRRLLCSNYPSGSFDQMIESVRPYGTGFHYLPIMTMGLSAQEFSRDDIAELYVFGMVRDQISSAVRLGLLGPMEGQQIQSHLSASSHEACQRSKQNRYGRACRTNAALEIAQANHHRLYSKLFQN